MAAERFSLRRRLSAALGGALLLLPLLLAGCSGTRFGEALSRSFPSPSGTAAGNAGAPLPEASTIPREGGAQANPASPATGSRGTRGQQPGPVAPTSAGAVTPAEAAAGSGPAGVTKPGRATVPGSNPAPGRAGSVTGAEPAAGPTAAQRPVGLAAANPAPYRVTIRLPQADPSAPAEVVTEALRAAGVPFEVETIERMGGASTAAPAALPAAPAVPQVRPAPPPR